MYYYEDKPSLEDRIADNENKVFSFIVNYFGENGVSPTVREITRHCDFKSTSTGHDYLKRLKEKGLINWEPTKHKTIVVLKHKSSAG